jgi:hypothetical protein
MADKEYQPDPYEIARQEYISKVFKASNKFKPYDVSWTDQKLSLKQKKNTGSKRKEAPVETKGKKKK